MAKIKAITALKHIDLFNAEKAQAVRDLGQKHGEEQRALQEAQGAEYEAVMGGIDRQRKLDVVEAVGRYVAAGLPVPHEVYAELGQQRALGYVTADAGRVPMSPPMPVAARGY